MKAKFFIVILVVFALISIVVVKLNKNGKNSLTENSTLEVNNELSTKVLEIEEITIENIVLNEKEKNLYFSISSKKEKNVKVSAVLLNPSKEDSANKITMELLVPKEKINVTMSLETIYNEPTEIKFEVER